MKNVIERPLDVLNNAKGKEVLVQLKNNRQMVGTLLAFDMHINIALDNAKEILGESRKNLGLTFLKGDLTEDSTIDNIKQIIGDKKVDVVLSDMSPDISGNYSVDQARSIWLCEHSLKFAEMFLKSNGKFVCKVFEGEDFPSFAVKIKQKFKSVKRFDPIASRKSSSEKYVIAKSFKNS